MSKTGRPNHRRNGRSGAKVQRHITVRSERRDPPDLHKLSRAVIALAMAEAAAEMETPPAIGRARTTSTAPTPSQQGGPQ